MADYLALKAEIAKPAYVGLSDAEIVAALNTTEVASEAAVSGASIGQLWARRGVLGAARERAQQAALTPAQRATAWMAIEMVDRDGFSGLDPAVPAQRAALVDFLDRLVTDTIMSAGDKTATLALLARTQTVGASIGWSVLGEMDETSATLTVAAARRVG